MSNLLTIRETRRARGELKYQLGLYDLARDNMALARLQLDYPGRKSFLYFVQHHRGKIKYQMYSLRNKLRMHQAEKLSLEVS